MSITEETMIERIKRFLIVGETLDGSYSFREYKLVNILTFIVLTASAVFSFIQALSSSARFWWILWLGFAIGAIYFMLIIRIDVTYVITKFRILRLETDLISRWFFRSSRLTGFTDLHYEHVESIHIGVPKTSAIRFYISLVAISVGWMLLTQQFLLGDALEFLELISALLVVAGLINIIFSLPFGGVRLIVQSISGDTMEFPEKKTPQEFVNDLILNCRTFLSYGAK